MVRTWPTGPDGVRRVEIVGALSLAADLGMGQPLEQGLAPPSWRSRARLRALGRQGVPAAGPRRGGRADGVRRPGSDAAAGCSSVPRADDGVVRRRPDPAPITPTFLR